MLGTELKDLIKSRKLTVQKAADILDVARQTIYDWIADEVPILKSDFVRKTLTEYANTGKTPFLNRKNPVDINPGFDSIFGNQYSDQEKHLLNQLLSEFTEVELLTAQAEYLDTIQRGMMPELQKTLIEKRNLVKPDARYLVFETQSIFTKCFTLPNHHNV